MNKKEPYGFPFVENTPEAEAYCENCSKRIKNKIEQYKSCKAAGKVEELSWITPIKDPILGYIKLIPEAQILLDTCYMQRLRRVLHLSFVYLAYPSATHTRFEHSLGVYQIVTNILGNSYVKNKVDKVDRFKVQMAALLHDVGQGPLSHLSDMMASILLHKKDISHEEFSHWLINPSYIKDETLEYCNNRFCLAKVLHDIIEAAFPDIPVEQRRQIRWDISYIVDGTKELKDPLGLRHLVKNETLDADKLDYLVRDAYGSGSSFALTIDVDRICNSIDIDNDKGIVIGENVIGSILQLLFTRSLAFVELYYHKVNRIASEMVLKAFQKVYNDPVERQKIEDIFFIKVIKDIYKEYEVPLFFRWDDFHFLYKFLSSEVPEFRKVVLDVLNRNLYKHIVGFTFSNKNDAQVKTYNWEKEIRMRREFEKYLSDKLALSPDDLLIYCFKGQSEKFNKGLRNVYARMPKNEVRPLKDLVSYWAVKPRDYILYICSKNELRQKIEKDRLIENAKNFLKEKGVDEGSIVRLILK